MPSTHASGKTVRHGGITKEGSRWLIGVMVEAAQTHVHKYDISISRAYGRIAEKRVRRSHGCCCKAVVDGQLFGVKE